MLAKIRLEDLALFGGPQAFDHPRHVNAPISAPRARFDAIFDTAWDNNWFTNDGPLVRQLEAELAARLEVPECILTCNGTIALELVIRALGLQGEVILPAFTFVSTANILRLNGLQPVFCDIDPETWNIDPDACAARVGPRTAAVIATHVWGQPCDTDRLQQICDGAGIPLLFDAAHAIGAWHQGRPIGTFGRAEVFSLHATKALHAFEGGVVTTADAALARDLRQRRNFGFCGLDRTDTLGSNAKMSEAHAAMGLANLERLDDTIAANRRRLEAYAAGLSDLPGLHLRTPGGGARSNWHYVVAEIEAETFGLGRDALVDLLSAENVLARRYFHPGCHRLVPHRQGPPPVLPVTEAVCERVLVFPAGASLALEDVARICDLIRFIAEHATSVAARL